MAGMLIVRSLMLTLCAGAALAAVSPKFVAIFGDSVSDVGNTYRVTNGSLPPVAGRYWKGRYSNGPVWTDYLAKGLGKKVKVLNLAYGGSVACSYSNFPNISSLVSQNVPDLSHQVGQYTAWLKAQSNKPAVDGSKRVSIIFTGHNDILNVMNGIAKNATQAISAIPMCIGTAVQQLMQAGEKHIIVMDLMALNLVALPLNPVQRQMLAQIVASVNAGLKQLYTAFQPQATAAGVNLYLFDTFNVSAVAIPQALPSIGITNVTSPCVPVVASNPASVPSSYCPQPNTYEFYDFIHPTTNVHNLLKVAFKTYMKQIGLLSK